jgi:hypothetical protein
MVWCTSSSGIQTVQQESSDKHVSLNIPDVLDISIIIQRYILSYLCWYGDKTNYVSLFLNFHYVIYFLI